MKCKINPDMFQVKNKSKKIQKFAKIFLRVRSYIRKLNKKSPRFVNVSLIYHY